MAFPTTIAPIQPPPDDPFLYGWRYVRHTDVEGGDQFDQIPLTLEDVLHPQEGDFIVHSEAHERHNLYLYDVFGAQMANDPSAVILHDVRVAWDIPGLKAHRPDPAVIFGVRERKNWSTFDIATEGVRPTVIVEITSPETAALDRSAKLEEYNLARVPLYLIVDTLTYAGQPRLLVLGYQQGPHGYQPIAADDNGRLWLDPLRLWIGVTNNEIVCYDETGHPLGDYRTLAAETATLTAALTAETAAHADAERRADDAEERLRALEAELQRLRRESR
jgi:Uma2 family endonuclease